MLRLGRLLTVVVGLLLSAPLSASAGEPLHAEIDRLIAQKAGDVPLAPPASDAEFLRRVYLDLAGRIPSAEEARRFLDDDDPAKRRRLIDALLNGPEYPRRMQELFHVMLMERRAENEHWTRFLRLAFENGKSWDRFVRDILDPYTEDPAARGAGFFLSARLVSEGAMAPVDVPGLTRDVGRLLAGVDLKCAQCHDHLYIDDYRQRDFQGLHTVFLNIKRRRGTDYPAVTEKLMTEKHEFMSVFEQVPMTTPPRVPGGAEIAIPVFDEGEQYRVPPDRKKRQPGVPKFSPLRELGRRLASGENELFARNIANRLWFVMMGRGLVEPLDRQHSGNPPTHPELLDLLARRFAERGFDIKWLLGELAMSETYQRTSRLEPRATPPPEETYALALEKRLSAEQLFWSTLEATGELDRTDREPPKPSDRAGSEKNSDKQTDAENTDGENPAPELTEAEKLVAGSGSLTKLKELFLDAFANPPREPEVDFEPTVKGALFVMNDERVLRLLERRPGNLVDRLSRISDPEKVADELYLSVVTRHPTPEERAEVAEYLGRFQGRRETAFGHLAWAMLASTEFCVNH